MKKLLIILTALAAGLMTSYAVLKEKDLPATLSVLRAELEASYNEQKEYISRYKETTASQHDKMVALMRKSDQISLMLYSQKEDFTFDLAYACHEATELYKEFSKGRVPYDGILDRLDTEIKRYDALITALKNLPPALTDTITTTPNDANDAHEATVNNDTIEAVWQRNAQQNSGNAFTLNDNEQEERAQCLRFANVLKNDLAELRESVRTDNEHYLKTAEKLKTLNDYALERYAAIQNNIFVNGDDNYFDVLASISTHATNARADVNEKYDEERVRAADGTTRTVHSQWRGPIVMGLAFFVLFYVVIAAFIGTVIIRLVPKRFRTDEFARKRVCLTLAVAITVFGIAVMTARVFLQHNFLLMASRLLMEYAWLLAAILFSLLIRLNGKQIMSGLCVYLPVAVTAFLVITFRIVFIPNNLVQLIFPPILLAFMLWQWWGFKRHSRSIPRSDRLYTWLSAAIMTGGTAAAWAGYSLLAVQVLIWWMFQLACIQTVTCVYDLLAIYESKVMAVRITGSKKQTRGNIVKIMRSRSAENIDKTWLYDFLSMAFVPVIAVISILLSIWWAADVFDLTEAVTQIFFTVFLDVPDVVQLSLVKIVLVLFLFFLFRYINYLIRALYQKFHRAKSTVNGKPNFTLANNIIGVCVWVVYFIIAIQTLKIPATAISVISAGLATGVGFAMKDLLENFFYGISLMAGRVRVGDFIECDGVRGKVESITYQSTQILTADGCIIAFLNSSLFNKNFKNITKNHSYELVKEPFGVAYGVNVDEVRGMIIKAVKGLITKTADGRETINSKRPISVVFDEFGDSSVNLYVTYWVLAEDKFATSCRVKEAVYDTLNAHGIEIPFPQRDIHIRDTVAPVKGG